MGRCYMTMIILVMIFLSNPVECLGQDIVNLNHIVQRGETIEFWQISIDLQRIF